MEDHLNSFKQLLLVEDIDALLISSQSQITHLTGYSNFSIEEREAFLIITLDHSYIITDGRYSEAIKREVAHFQLLEISSQNPIKKIFKNVAKKHNLKKVGIDEHNLTVAEHKFLQEAFSDMRHVEMHFPRSIKSSEEIDRIQKACKLGDQAFAHALKKLKPSYSEKQIAFEIEFFVKRKGATLSFDTIVGFGPNSAIPHHHTSDAKLGEKSGQFVLVDMGVKFKNYCSDMTRTVFWGKPSSKQEKMYKSVLMAQQKAVDYIRKQLKEGKIIKGKYVDDVARNFISEKGFEPYGHGLGHGVGVEIHEHPRLSQRSKDTLEPGMVFSIEPGIYIPGFGGVRIEDLFVIEGDNLRQLTQSPKDLTVLC